MERRPREEAFLKESILETAVLQSESDKHERARGSIQLAGAVISPSDEDPYTFTVSPAAGESYKLRAVDTRDRQMWLNRLRVVAEMHTRAIAHVSMYHLCKS